MDVPLPVLLVLRDADGETDTVALTPAAADGDTKLDVNAPGLLVGD